ISGNPAACAILRVKPGVNMAKPVWQASNLSSDEQSELSRHEERKDGSNKEGMDQWEIFADGRMLAPDELPMQAAGRTAQPTRYQELQLQFADGSVTWIYGNATPLFDEDGSVSGVVAVFTDITELKRAEQQIRESEERFRNMADHSPVMV